MNVSRLSLATLAVVVVAAGGGCTGLETGSASTPVATFQVALTATESVDADGRSFSLDSALAYIRHVELDLQDGATCEGLDGLTDGRSGSDSEPYTAVCVSGGDKIRLNGPWLVDLIAGTSVPPMAAVPLPAGRYERVDVRFDDADPAEGVVAEDDPMNDLTLRAAGTVPIDGAPTPFVLALKFNEDARFEAPGGVEVAEGDAATFALGLDPTAWFVDLPLAACAEDGDLTFRDGTLILEDGQGSCSDVENAIKDAIKSSGQLGGE